MKGAHTILAGDGCVKSLFFSGRDPILKGIDKYLRYGVVVEEMLLTVQTQPLTDQAGKMFSWESEDSFTLSPCFGAPSCLPRLPLHGSV